MVPLAHTTKVAYKALKVNKSRSFLTILGILIGIAAIIMMMSIGKGAEDLILGEIGGFGSETIAIRPGQQPTGPTDIAGTLFNDSLGQRDVDLLMRKSNVPHAEKVVPFVIVPGSIAYGGETYTPFIMGGDAGFFVDFYDSPLAEGNIFTEADARQLERVAVIGSQVKEELFGASDALGESVQIKGQKFRVIGILEPRGQVAFFDIDDLVAIPHTSAQKYLLGIDYFHEIIIVADDVNNVDRTVADIEATIREAHGIDDPDKDDFFVESLQGAAEQIQVVIGTLTAFLSSVVAIALVVGGVGGAPVERDRPGEFSADRTRSPAELIAEIEAVAAQVDRTLADLCEDSLMDRITIQGFKVTRLHAVYHAIEHFGYHLGQIVYVTKLRTGRDLGIFP